MARYQARRKQKIKAFTKILNLIANLSTSQTYKVGCIALKNDFSKMASFGYNGTYPGCPINPKTGGEELSLEPGKSGFLHAEENCIAKFRENDPENYIILITMSPCRDCTMRLVNAGFRQVYWLKQYRETDHLHIFNECGVKCGHIDELLS